MNEKPCRKKNPAENREPWPTNRFLNIHATNLKQYIVRDTVIPRRNCLVGGRYPDLTPSADFGDFSETCLLRTANRPDPSRVFHRSRNDFIRGGPCGKTLIFGSNLHYDQKNWWVHHRRQRLLGGTARNKLNAMSSLGRLQLGQGGCLIRVAP